MSISQRKVLPSTVRKSTVQPRLYDPTSLQRDANRYFGYTAQQTLDAVQSLYEKKLCTYPRTDSQYLTEDMRDTVQDLIRICAQLELFPSSTDFVPDIDRCINSKKCPTITHFSPPEKFIPQIFPHCWSRKLIFYCRLQCGCYVLPPLSICMKKPLSPPNVPKILFPAKGKQYSPADGKWLKQAAAM